jgi:putative ABC transport system substrate-binding protein
MSVPTTGAPLISSRGSRCPRGERHASGQRVRANCRRKLLILFGCAAVAPHGLFAQPKHGPIVIGWLHPGSRTAGGPGNSVLRKRLAALGWKDGSNYFLVERWGDARLERLPALAGEIGAMNPSVIVAILTDSVRAAAAAAPGVPVVQVQGASPVDLGLAASLARPGGMVTGITNQITEVSEKYLELLLDAAPGLKRIGFLVDDAGRAETLGSMKNARRSAARHSVEPHFAEARKPEEIDQAILHLSKVGAQGLVILPSAWFTGERRRIIRAALAQRWPVVAGPQGFADDGALLTYSADAVANFRRAAEYVDRILKGAKPGDLPIEQPTKFVLAVNLKTAKALGLTLPEPFLMRADRVIE